MILAWENTNVYGDMLKSVYGCIFLGVPHRGADIAYWANFPAKLLEYGLVGYGGNTAFLGALKKNSQTWRDISKQFVQRAAPLRIRTFFETQRLRNLLVIIHWKTQIEESQYLLFERLSTKIQLV